MNFRIVDICQTVGSHCVPEDRQLCKALNLDIRVSLTAAAYARFFPPIKTAAVVFSQRTLECRGVEIVGTPVA